MRITAKVYPGTKGPALELCDESVKITDSNGLEGASLGQRAHLAGQSTAVFYGRDASVLRRILPSLRGVAAHPQ